MPNWKVCRIVEQDWNETGFIFKTMRGKVRAIIDTPNGEQIIHEIVVENTGPERDAAHSKLTGMLLADGWEPLSTDKRGRVTTFRRQA